ncbi:MAG: hypothetical protein IT373_12450 [Polyangiaceae bacterium]|nr:hypothetical protein [Polyangiaceae bacterium]
MKRGLVLLALAATSVLACGDAATTAPPSSRSTAAASLADSDLPVAADFEEEAERSITPANYKSELDSLEKEIEAGN